MKLTRRRCFRFVAGGLVFSLALAGHEVVAEEALPQPPFKGVARPGVPQCTLGTVLTLKAELTNVSGQEQVVYHHGVPDDLSCSVATLAIYDEHGTYLGMPDCQGGRSEWGDSERSYAKIGPNEVFKTTAGEMLYSVRREGKSIRLVPGKYQVAVVIGNRFVRDRREPNAEMLRTNRVEIEFLAPDPPQPLPPGFKLPSLDE